MWARGGGWAEVGAVEGGGWLSARSLGFIRCDGVWMTNV